MELFKRRSNQGNDEKKIEEGRSALLRVYHASMRSFAKESLEEARKQYDDYDDASPWISDRVDLIAHGTDWVIYPHLALQTIEASDNWDAIEDEDELPARVESLSSFFSKIAFFAVRADIQEHIDELQKEFFR